MLLVAGGGERAGSAKTENALDGSTGALWGRSRDRGFRGLLATLQWMGYSGIARVMSGGIFMGGVLECDEHKGADR